MNRGARFVAGRAAAHVEARAAEAAAPYVRGVGEARDAAGAAARWHRAASGLYDEHRAARRARAGYARGARHVPRDEGRTGTARNEGRTGTARIVAGEWFHGPDERKRALASLATDYAALRNDLAIGLGADSGRAGSDAEWAAAVVSPTLQAWDAFLARVNASDLSIVTLEWSAIEEWHERLSRLRELARTRGVKLSSIDPVPLPKTIWERGGSGTGSTADTAVSFLKVGVFAVIAITGFVGFFSVMRTWRARSAAAIPPAPMLAPEPIEPARPPTVAEARAHLAALAAERGFSSIGDFEDSVVQVAAEHAAMGARVELAPDLEHLMPRVVAAASRRAR